MTSSIVIPGTCGACVHHGPERICDDEKSPYRGRRLWEVSGVPCGRYERLPQSSNTPRGEAPVQ